MWRGGQGLRVGRVFFAEGSGDHVFDSFVGFGDEVGGVFFGGVVGWVGGGDHGAGFEGEVD